MFHHSFIEIRVINQMELRLSLKKAKSAATTKASFLATMSHEIRTPLNGILGCADILLDSVKEEENKKLVRTITGCGDTLLNLINGILDFSKLESGKMEVEDEPFNLSENVDQIVHLFKSQTNSQLSTNSVDLILHFGKDVPQWVYGDVNKVRQILSNLISNALKFTPSGSVDLTVHAEKLINDEYKIQFSVKDNGIGISKEAQEK
jgi:two-component system sensor histidine kinase/response regulator